MATKADHRRKAQARSYNREHFLVGGAALTKWLTIAGVLGVVAGVALLAGLWIGSPGRGTYAVSTQPREDQITIFSHGEFNVVGPQITAVNFGPLAQSAALRITLDPSDYPSSATFRLEGVWATGSGAPRTHCIRLLDLTTNSGHVDSEVCGTTPADGNVQVRSNPFTLPSGPRQYTLEGKAVEPYSAVMFAARVIVEWEESIVMGPGPFPVGGYVRLLEGPAGGGGSPIAPASLAAGLMLLGAGGLYVVRLRRSADEVDTE
jgi:hypothetical protein